MQKPPKPWEEDFCINFSNTSYSRSDAGSWQHNMISSDFFKAPKWFGAFFISSIFGCLFGIPGWFSAGNLSSKYLGLKSFATCKMESSDMCGGAFGELEKEIELVGSPQSTTSHLRQSSKSSFLLDLPSVPAPASIWIWTAQPVIFSFVVWVLVKRFKVSRITAAVLPILKIWNKERSVVVAAAVLHERETESWQRLFDIYEEFIQRSETCPWIFRMRGFVISTGFALW